MHPSLAEPKRQEVKAEDYVNFLTTNAVPKAMTLSEIEDATKAVKTLQLVKIIREGKWESLKLMRVHNQMTST